jgi:AhpD family alkylhydroperoxidase
MTPRFDVDQYRGHPMVKALYGLSQAAAQGGLERSLVELVKIRASQLNGCAYCIDMHTKDARALGESEQRIYALSAWRETPFFTPRERAALDYAEAVTLVAETHVPDDVYERVREHFSEEEVVSLTFSTIVINSWNRLALASRTLAGTYQPPAAVTA